MPGTFSWSRAAVAAALGETTVLGGRAVGAPAAGTLGTAYGGAYAFSAIGLTALLAAAGLMVLASINLRRQLTPATPVPEPTSPGPGAASA
jgi:hypothetical protein